MNPARVLESQADRVALSRALLAFANTVLGGPERRQHLTNAGVDIPTLIYTGDSLSFATGLVARFRERVLVDGGTPHPMVQLLQYLLDLDPDAFGFSPDDKAALGRLLADVRLRAGALQARRSVGMLEDEQGHGIGTGVVVGRNLLLTCEHIFTKTGARRGQVRFDFAVGGDDYTVSPGVVWPVDLDAPVSRGGGPQPDYRLLRFLGDARRPAVRVFETEVNSGLPVRLIHHPRGEPARVSEPGQVVQTGEDYLLHDIPTDDGSSGAPLFDTSWRLVALHRGLTPRVVVVGTSEAVPMHAVWPAIQARVGTA